MPTCIHVGGLKLPHATSTTPGRAQHAAAAPPVARLSLLCPAPVPGTTEAVVVGENAGRLGAEATCEGGKALGGAAPASRRCHVHLSPSVGKRYVCGTPPSSAGTAA
eukprot:357444-Chlamydomonas_euryale.AAC.3